MSEDKNKILYILIGTGSKPLAGYSDLSGDFIHDAENQLGRCQKNKSASITTETWKIFYENTDNVTYLVMTLSAYPMAAAVSCIESLKKEFSTLLSGRNFAVLSNYGLNGEMKEKIKMKFEYYNENTEVVSDKLENLKGAMGKYKEEVFKAAKELNERGDKLREMQDKAEHLEGSSLNFKKGAIKVRKAECCKKYWFIWTIIVVVVIIVLVIILVAKPWESSSSKSDSGGGDGRPSDTDTTDQSDIIPGTDFTDQDQSDTTAPETDTTAPETDTTAPETDTTEKETDEKVTDSESLQTDDVHDDSVEPIKT